MPAEDEKAYRRSFQVQTVYSYHEGWNVPIRAWVKIPYLPGFFIEFQEGLFFILLEVLAYAFDSMGIGFKPLTQYGVIPVVLTILMKKIKPEGKYLYQWCHSFFRYMLTEKETDGALNSVDTSPDRLIILSRLYPGEKRTNKRKRRKRWFRRSNKTMAAS